MSALPRDLRFTGLNAFEGLGYLSRIAVDRLKPAWQNMANCWLDPTIPMGRNVSFGGGGNCAARKPPSRCKAEALRRHPSGDPSPSAADVQVTRQLREAAKAVDIELLDHLVIPQELARWVLPSPGSFWKLQHSIGHAFGENLHDFLVRESF